MKIRITPESGAALSASDVGVPDATSDDKNAEPDSGAVFDAVEREVWRGFLDLVEKQIKLSKGMYK